MLCKQKEVFYGGAAGGGKSVGLLMCALQYVDRPGYAALLLRRTYTDLSLPGALMDIANEWLRETDAIYSAPSHTWIFPSGATLTFGFLESENDKYRYQSSEFQFIGFDELTQFTESQYTYLFSRLRRLADSGIPLRVRCTSNPGGIGHDWVKERFIENRDLDQIYIPANLYDNPHLDKQSYESALKMLDPVTQAQLLNGDWTVRNEGNMFRREWFEMVDDVKDMEQTVRFWDLAATKPKKGTDPDYTVGAKLGMRAGTFYVLDVIRTRLNPGEVKALIKQTAILDGRDCRIFQEQEGGSSGKMVTDDMSTQLAGYSYMGVPSTGSKVARAQPVSASCFNRHIKILNAHWTSNFLSEIEQFPGGAHDDQVDAFAGAFNQLTSSNEDRFSVMSVGRMRG